MGKAGDSMETEKKYSKLKIRAVKPGRSSYTVVLAISSKVWEYSEEQHSGHAHLSVPVIGMGPWTLAQVMSRWKYHSGHKTQHIEGTINQN